MYLLIATFMLQLSIDSIPVEYFAVANWVNIYLLLKLVPTSLKSKMVNAREDVLCVMFADKTDIVVYIAEPI